MSLLLLFNHSTTGGGIASDEAFGTLTIAVEQSPGSPGKLLVSYVQPARELTGREESQRALLAACALEIATTDWAWSGADASLFAAAVWTFLGWLLSRVPRS